MSRSLVRTIYSLSKYERYKKQKFFDEYGQEYEVPLLTRFVKVWDSFRLSEKSCELILAADRLIGDLFTYGGEISIGQRYFQPTFYKPKYISVYMRWGRRDRDAFCVGCCNKENECSRSPFSSWCPRFRTAWAVEHVVAAANRLVQLNRRKEEVQCLSRY